MRGAFLALRSGILAFPLLAGPWLMVTGCLFIWQAVSGEPLPDPGIRVGAFAMGVVCLVWTLHGIVSGVRLSRNWWLMTCSVLNLVTGGSAAFSPSDPAYLQYVMVPASLGWSLWLFLKFFERRRAVHAPSE